MSWIIKEFYNRFYSKIFKADLASKNNSIKKINKILSGIEKKHILFVCTGNICRSAFAEGYTKSKELGGDIIFSSAGIYTNSNLPANQKTIEISKDHAIDLNQHRTKTIEDIELKNQNLFFVFEPIHALSLILKHKVSAGKIFYLGHLTEDPKFHITDPYNKSDLVFREVFNDIATACDLLSELIKAKLVKN